MGLIRLKKRLDFLRIAQAKRVAKTSTMLIQCHYSSDENDQEGNLRAGFTASRRVGNAVKRNRAKRRLKSLADQHLKVFFSEFCKDYKKPSLDFVFIAVPSTATADFQQLYKDFIKGTQWCLTQIQQKFSISANQKEG
jgi:ribonuclease P protein component